jgi:glutamate dehydrogenase
VPTAAQTGLYLEFRRLLDRAARWFLTTRPTTLDISAEIERFAGTIGDLGPRVGTLLRGDEKKRLERKVTEFRKSGVPDDLAEHAASLLDWYSLLDIVDIATDTGREPDAVAPLYYLVSERFGIDTMLGKVTRLPRDDRWDALARGALRDDLYSVLESLTRAVIETGGTGTEPAEQWKAWEDANKDALTRSTTALAAIRRLDNPNIAALSVALRTLRSVIRSGAAT